jgi:hypothetical protein
VGKYESTVAESENTVSLLYMLRIFTYMSKELTNSYFFIWREGEGTVRYCMYSRVCFNSCNFAGNIYFYFGLAHYSLLVF